MATRKCTSKHRTLWIIGDQLAWCYQCGAIRSLKSTGVNSVAFSEPQWTYPTGPGGENPAVVQYVKKLRREQLVPSGSLGY